MQFNAEHRPLAWYWPCAQCAHTCCCRTPRYLCGTLQRCCDASHAATAQQQFSYTNLMRGNAQWRAAAARGHHAAAVPHGVRRRHPRGRRHPLLAQPHHRGAPLRPSPGPGARLDARSPSSVLHATALHIGPPAPSTAPGLPRQCWHRSRRGRRDNSVCVQRANVGANARNAARAQMAEVARVLRPGGVFVGTTVMKVGAGLGEVLGDDVVRPLASVRRRPRR
jgi:hypothetical protein